jgi:hypothetical protein
MSFIGPIPGVQGSGEVRGGAPRPTKGAGGKQVKAKDEVVTGADSVELERTVKGLSSNEQEDAREDHQKGGYTPEGRERPDEKKPRLDLAG